MKFGSVKKNFYQDILIHLAGILIVVLLWHIISIPLDSTRLPSPFTVIKDFVLLIFPSKRLSAAGISKTGAITNQLLYTTRMVMVGVLLGGFIGCVLGLILTRFKSLYSFLNPPIEVIRAIPPLALLPFLGMWVGPTSESQLILVASYVGLMVLITTITAVKNLNPLYEKFAATLGANKDKIFLTIIFPAIIPELVGGLRVAMGMAWGFQVVAELVGSRYGIGLSLLMMVPRFMSSEIIATILWITFIALITDLIFLSIIRRVTYWQPIREVG